MSACARVIVRECVCVRAYGVCARSHVYACVHVRMCVCVHTTYINCVVPAHVSKDTLNFCYTPYQH